MFFSWERSQKPYFYIGVNLMKIGITKNGTLVEARKADRNEKYFCPSCQRALKLCSGQYKKNYFAHQSFTKKQGYQPKGETKRHLMGKKRSSISSINVKFLYRRNFIYQKLSKERI